MHLDFTSLAPRDAYQWMVTTILPRPIAWVSTISADGKTNLAPFSFFQGICANPPTLMFVPVNNRQGGKKDTSALLPYGESEFEKFGVASAPSDHVRPPRVAAAPVAFECRLDRIVHFGEGPLAANVIFGRILAAHISDDVLGADGKPDSRKLDLVGRLGGEDYTTTRDVFSLIRPD